MAYTTPAQVKRELPYNYQKGADKKLTEDGYVSVAGTFNETAFLTYFIDQTGSFIDGYLTSLGTPPFAYSGVLDKINKALAVYEVELYLKSAVSDRTVSVTLYANYQWAMKMLDKFLDGTLQLTVADEAPNQNTVRLIEPDDDGVTLNTGDLEANILMGGADDATEIPE